MWVLQLEAVSILSAEASSMLVLVAAVLQLELVSVKSSAKASAKVSASTWELALVA